MKIHSVNNKQLYPALFLARMILFIIIFTEQMQGQDGNVFNELEDSIPHPASISSPPVPEAAYGPEQIDSVLNEIGYDSTIYFKKSDKFRTEILRMIRKSSSSDQVLDSILNSRSAGFHSYSGKIIRTIEFRQLEIFGQSIRDTTMMPKKWSERMGNSMHIHTQEKVLRNRLLFHSGDTINPLMLADNERIIRELPYIDDASIYIQEVAEDTVDILVYTKDVFAFGVGFEVFDVNYGRAGIWNKNLLGIGHEIYYYLSWKFNEDQNYGHNVGYRIPSIGKTFITTDIEYINRWKLEAFGISLNRDFITPETKYAGGAGFGWIREVRNIEFPDTVYQDELLKYNAEDIWFGRSYMYRKSAKGDARSNIALTGRITRYKFHSRPDVDVSVLSEFFDRTTILASVGLTHQYFRKSSLIYNFGRSEDIPLGSMITITAGVEMNEYLDRPYVGLSYSLAYEWHRAGYLYQRIETGGFINEGIEQGQIGYYINYFTPLFNAQGRYNYRLFASGRYRLGLNRFEDEFIQFSKSEDIRGFTGIKLRGNQLASLQMESVCYSPHKPLGFRFVYFVFLDAGIITNHSAVLIQNPVYTGFGVGLRFKNENLVFTTIQFRLAYYPLVPDEISPEYLQLTGVPDQLFDNFIMPKPEILPYK